MRVTSLRMQNFRSFTDSDEIPLKAINVLIGANNSGKSSILRGLHQLQQGLPDLYGDVRVGSSSARILVELTGVTGSSGWTKKAKNGNCTFIATLHSSDRRNGGWSGEVKDQSKNQIEAGNVQLPNSEPNHFVIPYMSKRKAVSYNEDIREQFVLAVTPDVSYLAAKLSRLANPAFPLHATYADACKSILGFVVTAIPAPSGQRPGIYLPNQDTIPIEQMGEGVPNIVHLLVNLATSTNKLFLVEEPENDLHPTALRALLDLMIKSSATNQFVVSTHSNIVVRHLCGVPDSQLLRVSSPIGKLPSESKIELVPPTPEARIAILRELGYDLWDFDLWEGWLILEESSAESMIRNYLIPWFAPKLTRVRTISANGVDRVEPLLDDFLRLVVFTNLQPAYRERTWVRVDNDDRGQNIVSELKNKYRNWPEDRFRTLNFDQFERYYPQVFTEKVNEVLKIQDRQARRVAKKKLLSEVMRWLDEDLPRGKDALQASAANLIEDLKIIESQLNK